MKKIAVVLCGSGFGDGSEIRESVATLWALSRNPVQFQCFAPDAPQADVVNCLTGQVIPGETRNMRVEAARIARGDVRALSELRPADWDGIILPGGFGAAKNLCTFARQGSRGTVLPELEAILAAMHAARKPIGAICIAPAIVALALRETPLELTVGPECEAAQELVKLGHRHFPCPADGIHTDFTQRVVTTPAYMHDSAPLHEIFEGIRKLVEQVVALA